MKRKNNDASIGGRRRASGNGLILLGALLLLASAAAKFAQVPAVVEQMSRLGFKGGKLELIAGLEVVSALLFLLPSTRSFGLLLVSAYMGGAIATHVQHDQLHLAAPASAVLCLIWLGAWLRHPEILWSLDRRADDSAGLPVENDVKMAVGISRET